MGRKKKAGSKEYKDTGSSNPTDAGKSEQKEDKLSEAAGGQPLPPTDTKPSAVASTSKGGDGKTQDPPEPGPQDSGADGKDKTKTADTGAGGKDKTKTADTGASGKDNTKTADTGADGKDETKTADTGTGGKDETKTADTGAGGKDKTKTADTGAGGKDKTKTADTGAGGKDETKTADTGAGGKDKTKTADTGAGGKDKTKTADTGAGGKDKTKTADTGAGGKDETKTADTGAGGKDKTKTADTGAGGKDKTKTADTGADGKDKTKTADTGAGGKDKTKTADTGAGGKDKTKTADTGAGGKDKTKTADTGADGKDETKTADTGASGGAEAFTSDPKTPTQEKKKKKKKKKKTGGVDVDGKGVDLAGDLMKGATGSSEDSDDSADNADNADDYEVNPVELMVALCEARLQGLPKKGRKYARLGIGDQVHCRALGIEREHLEEVGKELTTRLSKLYADEQLDVLDILWDKEPREYQLLVVEMVTDVIIPLSRELGFHDVFLLLKKLVSTKSGRDTVDRLATCHLNALAYLEPPDTWQAMDEWIEEDDPWLQRAALLHQICLGEYMDSERLKRYCSKFSHLLPDTVGFEERWTAIEQALTSYANNCKKEGKPTADDDAIAFVDEQARKASRCMSERLKTLQKKLTETKRQKLREKVRTKKR